jgi:hypothetical protein
MTKAQMKEMIATACQESAEHLADPFEQNLQILADNFAGLIVSNAKPTQQ